MLDQSDVDAGAIHLRRALRAQIAQAEVRDLRFGRPSLRAHAGTPEHRRDSVARVALTFTRMHERRIDDGFAEKLIVFSALSAVRLRR